MPVHQAAIVDFFSNKDQLTVANVNTLIALKEEHETTEQILEVVGDICINLYLLNNPGAERFHLDFSDFLWQLNSVWHLHLQEKSPEQICVELGGVSADAECKEELDTEEDQAKESFDEVPSRDATTPLIFTHPVYTPPRTYYEKNSSDLGVNFPSVSFS